MFVLTQSARYNPIIVSDAIPEQNSDVPDSIDNLSGEKKNARLSSVP